MDITSFYFVILSVISMFIYYLIKNEYRVLFLTLLSCAFIATYSYILLIYVLAYVLINYFIGLKIPDNRFKKLLFITGILFNLTQLLLLKYVTFTINPVFELLHIDLDLTIISRIIVPIGVSFFTLQGIGYLINVNIGWEKPEKNFVYFLLYISFFPRFLAGPIDRSNLFLPQLRINKTFDGHTIMAGFRLILFGLFKKVAIANQLEPIVNGAYSNIGITDEYSMWAVLLLQPLYLYFDFSGYTDIAIGLAKMFGIDLLPNFIRPFFARNMTNFWKRFHISLSSWFNDYIFRQVSFRYRKWGTRASVFALLLTWVLFGIWHGAGWTFMLLGFLQAMAIIYEFFTKKIRARFFLKLPEFPRIWIGRILTYLFYCVSLVLFFAPDMDSVVMFFSKLKDFNGISFSYDGITLLPYMLIIYIPLILILELINEDLPKLHSKLAEIWNGNNRRCVIFRWTVYSLIITILFINALKNQQFVYANF